MRHQLFFSILLASALLDETKSQTLRTGRDPFRISIQTANERVVAGMQIPLEINVLNTSPKTIVAKSGYQAYDGDPTYEYDCRDSSGKSVSKQMRPIGSLHDAPSIRPGDVYRYTVFLNRVCDLSRPGQYEIRLSRGVPMGSHYHVVKSNKITITVVP
jgi:hypothetical protein